mgnify:CR=1 FL=1
MSLALKNIDNPLLLLSKRMSADGLNILYIEDNFDDKIILEEIITDTIQVKTFKTSETLSKALELIQKYSFDLIFLDLSLPDGKGLSLIKKLNQAINRAIPVIVLTGQNDHSIAIKALKYGAQDFFVKGEYNPILLSKAIYYAIQRHRVQHELQVKNKELTLIQNRLNKAEEMADTGSWELDLTNQTIKLSDGMKKLLAINDDTEIYQVEHFKEYIDPADIDTLISYLSPQNDKKLSNEFEIKLIRNKEFTFHTLCRVEIIEDEKGFPIKIYGVNVDITETKEAEQVKEEFTIRLAQRVRERTFELERIKHKLEQSLSKEKELNELKSRFVSTASHQFRTPLTVILSNISLIEILIEKTKQGNPVNFNKYTNRIKNEINRMVGIVNEVLTLGKISSGGVVPEFENIDVTSICKKVVAQYNQIQKDGRKASLKINGNVRLIHLDKQLFEEALSNIISNAFKYSIGKPAPEVTLDFSEQKTTIAVKDHGLGIPDEDLKNLFTPFFRASNVLDIPGNGLGTTIMKEYVEINNGLLSVDSKLNKGSSFNIEFQTD